MNERIYRKIVVFSIVLCLLGILGFCLYPLTPYYRPFSELESSANIFGNSGTIQIRELELLVESAIQKSALSSIDTFVRLASFTLSITSITPLLVGGLLWVLRQRILNIIAEKVEPDIKKHIEKYTDQSLQAVKSDTEELKSEQDGIRAELKIGREARLLFKKYLSFQLSDSDDFEEMKSDDIEEMKKTIAKASEDIQDTIFYETKEFFLITFKNISYSPSPYLDGWKAYQELRILGKTIPIFEAILGSESEQKKRFHQTRAYLAYARIYNEYPKISTTYPEISNETLDQAIALLSEAIQIRDQTGEKSYYSGWYEFKRAIFTIWRYGWEESDNPVFDQIKEDLSVAMKDNPILKRIIEEIKDNGEVNNRFQAMYITPPEAHLIKNWYERNPN